jgi:quinoprotein dehydrogenase-associated probable ABC transporter substrate-binding protein
MVRAKRSCRNLLVVAAGIAAGWIGATGARPAQAQTAEVQDRAALRVCADPSNLPFSNEAGEGFENKIAELLAKELGLPVEYTWFPQATGFIRATLRARRCDLVVGVPTGNEMLQNTNPYYRSAYALVLRTNPGPGITALDDPRLKSMRIGLVAGTPPASAIARQGLMGQVRPYHLMVDTRFDSPGKQMVADVAAGEIDVGVLWGPIAGYYARRHGDALRVVPLKSQPGQRMDFRISMGLRFNEPEWKHKLNELIQRNQAQIEAILAEYGVPLLD